MSGNPQQELERLAAAAREQGRVHVEAVCLLAISKIEELETILAALRAGRRRTGDARAQQLTPQRRKEIAEKAARARWSRAS